MTLTSQQVDALKKITSPSVANAIATFKVRPREQGNLSSDIKALFPEMGPMVGYAVTAIIRAEAGPIEGTAPAPMAGGTSSRPSRPARESWSTTSTSRAARRAQWGEVQANIHRALGCVGWSPTAPCGTSTRCGRSGSSSARLTSRCRTPTCTWSTSASPSGRRRLDQARRPRPRRPAWRRHHSPRDRHPDPRGHRQGRGRREEDHLPLPGEGLHPGQAEGAVPADPPGDVLIG